VEFHWRLRLQLTGAVCARAQAAAKGRSECELRCTCSSLTTPPPHQANPVSLFGLAMASIAAEGAG
jgi:hypothetical protein